MIRVRVEGLVRLIQQKQQIGVEAMFTVKVVRRSPEGTENVDLYRARHVNTFWDPDNPAIRHVLWTEADSGEHPSVSLGSQLPIEDGEMRVIEVFVENENGKTTEVIR